MNNNEIKQRIAPCGLHCGGCFAFTGGAIARHSQQLKQLLGNFDVYAKRFVDLLDEPIFEKYPDFAQILTLFADAQCTGCRNEKCKLFKNCKVRDCHKIKEVEFCYQCPEFPCGNTGFDQHLENRLVQINEKIKETGAEAYYDEIKDKPRY